MKNIVFTAHIYETLPWNAFHPGCPSPNLADKNTTSKNQEIGTSFSIWKKLRDVGSNAT